MTTFEVNRHEHTLAGLRAPLRVVHLSDLHYGLYTGERQVAAWIRAALAQNPDLVVITGDFVDRFAWRSWRPLLRQLSRLRAPLGVWGVWGNHDYDLGAAKAAFEAHLRAAGVHLLVNTGVKLRDDLFLAGLDDWLDGRPNLQSTLAERPPGCACLLMSHNPDVLPELPQSVDLTLCGHTHGGQIKLPVLGAVKTSSAYGKRFLEGWVSEPVTAFVSRGLGYAAVPVRYRSAAEVVVLELV